MRSNPFNARVRFRVRIRVRLRARVRARVKVRVGVRVRVRVRVRDMVRVRGRVRVRVRISANLPLALRPAAVVLVSLVQSDEDRVEREDHNARNQTVHCDVEHRVCHSDRINSGEHGGAHRERCRPKRHAARRRCAEGHWPG